MDKKIMLSGGAFLFVLISFFGSVQAYTITVHNRTPYKLKIKFDHPAATDNHKDVNANSTYKLNTGLKCTRSIEIEKVYTDAAKPYKGVKKDNPGGNCDSVTFWITRNKDRRYAIETR